MEEKISDASFLWMALAAVIFAVIIFIIVRGCLIPWIAKTRRGKNSRLWTWIEDHLSTSFVIVWFFCFFTYFIGTYVGTTDLKDGIVSIFSVVPMAVIHATEAFLGMSDISAIHADRHNDPLFMVCFDLCHFLAVCVTLCFVFKHLGYYMVAKYRLMKESASKKTYSHAYIFWGTNPQTLALAKSTLLHHTNTNEDNYIIIFVKTPMEDSSGDERMGFDKILNFVTMKEQEMRDIDHLGNSIVVNSHHRLSTLTLPDGNGDEDILAGKLRIKSLAAIIERTDTTHIFFLSDDRDANINATTNIVRDRLLRKKNLHVYCRARKNSKAGWMEHYDLLQPEEHTTIHLVDSSLLSVYQLKSHVESQPVSFLKFNPQTAIPTASFTSLIIGFHETGLEALKFLYEFGTFVSSDGNRYPGQFVVMDKDVSSYEGGFYAKSPALKGDKEISLIKCGVNDKEYWRQLTSLLPTLHYAVIAIGDDDKGINAAVDICRMAYSCSGRNEKRRLTVYVKSYSPDNLSRIKRIADDTSNICKDRNISIKVFGSTTDIFTYDLIINDRIIREAKLYNYNYEGGKKQGKETDEEAIDRVWNNVLGINGKQGEGYNLAEIQNIERKRDQNVSNSLHGMTKIQILKACNALPHPPHAIRLLLAQQEHERWVAASKLAGWQRGELDPIHKFHTDICPWSEIRSWDKEAQAKTQSYDFKVVDSTIELYMKSRQQDMESEQQFKLK